MSREKTVYFYPEYYAEIIGKKIEILPPFLNPHQCPHKKPQRLYEKFIKVNTNSLQDIVNFMNKYNFFYVPKKLIKKEWLKLADTVIGEDICINAKIFKKLQEEFINFLEKSKNGKLEVKDRALIEDRASKNVELKKYVPNVYIDGKERNKKIVQDKLKKIKRLELEDFFNQVMENRIKGISKDKDKWISERINELNVTTLHLWNMWINIDKIDSQLEKNLSKEQKERINIIKDLKDKGVIKINWRKITTPAYTFSYMYSELFNDIDRKEDWLRKADERANPFIKGSGLINRDSSLRRELSKPYLKNPTLPENILKLSILKLVKWLNNRNFLLKKKDKYYFCIQKPDLIDEDFKFEGGNMKLLELAQKYGWIEYTEEKIMDKVVIKYNLSAIKKGNPSYLQRPEDSPSQN